MALLEPFADIHHAQQVLSRRSEELRGAITVVCHFKDPENDRRRPEGRRKRERRDRPRLLRECRRECERRLPWGTRFQLLRYELLQIMEHRENLGLLQPTSPA